MSKFEPHIYNTVSEWYILYNGDKNRMITHVLVNIKDNNERIKYIDHIDFYIVIMDTQKEVIKNTSELHNTYQV